MTRKTTILSFLLGVACCTRAAGQSPATLKVEIRNLVEYQFDTSDPSRFATNSGITQGGINSITGPCVGVSLLGIGDIVAEPWHAIPDTTRASIRYETYEILQSDGVTPVGTVMTNGMNNGGPSPPGPPVGTLNFAIVGGTGAYLAVRGQTGNAMQGLGSAAVPVRAASITESPANRRINGGRHVVFTLYIIPMFRPTVVATPRGPAIMHSDEYFSLVSASKPAAAGEILSLFATGLGPTRESLLPGQPFRSSPLAVVNSPVEVTVDGKSA
jgi:hypothetical protein